MSMDLSKFERFVRNFKEGEIIFCEYEPGDAFYLIRTGRVKIVKIIGNIEKIVDILEPGEFFGEMALLENAPRSASIIALESCEILEFNRSNFEVLMTGNPQMVIKLLSLFAQRIYDQKRRFGILTLSDEYARVADVFVMLAETSRFEFMNSDTGKRIYKNSVADIAQWAGMRVDRCMEILSHFQGQQRVRVFTDRIEVVNIHDLVRFVNSRRKFQKNRD